MSKNVNNLCKSMFKNKVYIMLITIIFAFSGVCYTLVNVKYVADQKILLGTSENSNLVDTYKELIKGSAVLEEVIQNLDLNMNVQELYDLVQVNTIKNTNLIRIRVYGEDAETVKMISNELSNVFVDTVKTIYNNNEIYNIDSTFVNYYNERSVIFGVCSAVVGFLVACLFFILCHLLDTKIKDCNDIENITGLKPLISIPKMRKISKKELNLKNINYSDSEIFKNLMTNIQFININNLRSKSILITSAMPLDGKTYVANNLAMEFAKAGKKVIIIDSDMRKGRLDKIFNLPNNLGFSNYLSSLDSNGNIINERITRYVNDTEIKNLNVITAGTIPPNPAELLKTDKVKELIKDLKVFYDVIIFDSVPVLEAPEAQMLSKVCDLTLLLVSYDNTKKEELEIAYKDIHNVAGNVIGVGLNKIPERKLKKKINVFKSNIKQKSNNIFKKTKFVLKFFEKIGNIFNRNEKVKLIEAGAPMPEENNIIKDVYESKMAQSGDNLEIKYKMLDEMKDEENEKANVIENKSIQVKSKFDLIREQQERQETTEISNPVSRIEEQNNLKLIETNNKVENKVEKIENREFKSEYKNIQEMQRLQKEKAEEEKKIMREQIANYQEIDFTNPENLTEELIRRQVEIDEIIRLAEKEEEEEALRLKQAKAKEKSKKKQERKEKKSRRLHNIASFFTKSRDEYNTENNEFKVDKKVQKENEKIENKARIEKVKEEKRFYREIKKQRQREEIRINEEIQEDNLYPRIRM